MEEMFTRWASEPRTALAVLFFVTGFLTAHLIKSPLPAFLGILVAVTVTIGVDVIKQL